MKTRRGTNSPRKPGAPRISAKKKKKAVEVLAGWAKQNTAIEFIDMNGLTHPGTLIAISSDELSHDFCFLAESGAQKRIFSLLWKHVEVDAAIDGSIGESVHIDQGDGTKFCLRAESVLPSDAGAQVAAEALLASWCQGRARLQVMCHLPIAALVFMGSITKVSTPNFVVEPPLAEGMGSLRFIFSLAGAVCRLSEEAGYPLLSLHWRSRPGHVMRISEAEGALLDLVKRYPPSALPN
jgi:hypothetical protein